MNRRVIAVALLCGCIAVAASIAAVRDTKTVAWQELSFSAHKLMMSAETTVRVLPAASDELRGVLRDGPEINGLKAAGRILSLQVLTDLPMGRHERVTTWIDSSSGAALQREKLVYGRKNYWKLRRFTADGVWQWRAAPVDRGEKELPSERWTKRKQSHQRWSAQPSALQVVSDPYCLLYLISAARLDRPHTSLEILVPSKERLVVLRFERGAQLEHEVDFDEHNGEQVRRRSGRVSVCRITGEGRYLGSEESADDVETGFMGMRGGITVLVEQGTGIPVEVSGRSKGIGRLEVQLRRVVLR